MAYLQEVDELNHSHLAFVMACSRVAHKCNLTMPCLELCAAHSVAQLAHLFQTAGVSSRPNRWATGPSFLYLPPNQWPVMAPNSPDTVSLELRETAFCGHMVTHSSCIPGDLKTFKSWNTLVDRVAQSLCHTSSPSFCLPDSSPSTCTAAEFP